MPDKSEYLLNKDLLSILLPKYREASDSQLEDAYPRLKQLTDMRDDRAAVLVGSLIVEQAIGAVLKAFLPKYNVLRENDQYSFSLSISLLKSMALVPPDLLSAANTVRRIRNSFAHDLDIRETANLKPKLLDAMRQSFTKLTGDSAEVDDATAFVGLVSFLDGALRPFVPVARRASELLRGSEFTQMVRELEG